MESTLSLSIDIGGTFTDFTLHDTATGELKVHKALTSPDDPSRALIQGLREFLEEVGASTGDLRLIVHSTTLATNSIIERKGAKTALLTTKGFRDILEFGRERIYDMHDLHARFPDPLVPRSRRVEVSERADRDGLALTPVDLDGAAAVIEELVEQGVESIAVSLLHAYRNPAHERALKEVVENGRPDLRVSLSSDVAPGHQRVRAYLDDSRGRIHKARRLTVHQRRRARLDRTGLRRPASGDALGGRRHERGRRERASDKTSGVRPGGGRARGGLLQRYARRA